MGWWRDRKARKEEELEKEMEEAREWSKRAKPWMTILLFLLIIAFVIGVWILSALTGINLFPH
jgi:cell division septal protein FtsQ